MRTLSALNFGAMQLVAIRASVSVAALFIFLAIKSPAKLKIKIKDWWMFAGTGVLSFALFNYCYFYAMNTISLSAAAILLYTAPVFVALMSVAFFKEKMTKYKTAALILAFVGCAASSGLTGGAINTAGVIYGLLSGFLYALYSIFGKIALKKYSSETVTFYTFIFASLGALPLSRNAYSPAVDAPLFFYLILFALVCGAIPYVLYTGGLSKLEPDKASIMASVEPVTASFVGMIFFAEPFSAGSVIGLCCIIAAIVLLRPNGKKRIE